MMGKVRLILRGALAGVDGASNAFLAYGVSTTQARMVLTQVTALFGEVEVASAYLMMPYFEGAAKAVGLRPEIGIHVYTALYFLFGV